MFGDPALEVSPENGIKRRRQASEDVDTPAAKKSTTDASLAADKATLRREECRQDIRALYIGYMSLMESGDDAEAAKFFHGLLETVGANSPLHRRRLAARLISRTLWRFPAYAEQAFHVLAALYDGGRPDDQDLPKPTSTSASCPSAPGALAQLEVDTRRDALCGMSNVLDVAIFARQETTLMHLVIFLMRIVHRQGLAGASSKGRSGHSADANGGAPTGPSPCSRQTSHSQQPPLSQHSRPPSEPVLPRKRPWDHGGRRINGLTSAPQPPASSSSGASAGSPPDPPPASRCGYVNDKAVTAAGGSNGSGVAPAVHAATNSDSGFASTLLVHAFSMAPRTVLTACLRAISATATGRPSDGGPRHLQNPPSHMPTRHGGQDDAARDCEAAEALLGLLLRREAAHSEQGMAAADGNGDAAASRNGGDAAGKRAGNRAGGHIDAVAAVVVLPGVEEEQGGGVAADGHGYGGGGTNEGGSGNQTATTAAGGCLAESVLQAEAEVQPWLADVISRLLGMPSLKLTPQLSTHLRTLLQICRAATLPKAGTAAATAAAANSNDAAAAGPSGEPHFALPPVGSAGAHTAVGNGRGDGAETATTASGAQPPAAAAASSLLGSDDRSVPMDLDQSISTAAMRHNEAGGGGVGGGSMAAAAAGAGPADTAATPAPPPSQPPLLPLPLGGVPAGLRGGPVCQAEPCLRISGVPPGTSYATLLTELTPMGGIESVHAVGSGLGAGVSLAGRMMGQGAAATTTAGGLGDEVLVVFSSWEGAARCYQALAGGCQFDGTRPLQVEFCRALPQDSPAAGCHAPGGSDVVWVSAPGTHTTRMAIIEALTAAALPSVEKMAQVDGRAPGWLLKMASPSVIPQVVTCLMRHLGPAQPLPPPPPLQGLVSAASGGFGSSAVAAAAPITPSGPATVAAPYGAPTFTQAAHLSHSYHVGSHAGGKAAATGMYGGSSHVSVQQHPDPSSVAVAPSPAGPPAAAATAITQLPPPPHVSGPTVGGHQALTPQDLAAASVAEAAAAVAARGGPRSGADRWAPVVIPSVPQPTQLAAASGSAAVGMQHVQSLMGHMSLPTTMNPAVAAAVRHAPLLLPQPGMGGLASHAVTVGGSAAGVSTGGSGVAMHMSTSGGGKLSPPHQSATFPPARQPQSTPLACANQSLGHTPQPHNTHPAGYPLSSGQPYQQPHPHSHALPPHPQDPTQAHGTPGHPLGTPLTPQSSLLQSQHQHQQHQTGPPQGASSAPGANLYGSTGSHSLQHMPVHSQHPHQPHHSQSAQPQAGQQQQQAAPHPRLQHGYSGDWQSSRLPPPPPIGLCTNQLPPPPPPPQEGLTAHSLPPPPPPPPQQQQQPTQHRAPGGLHVASPLTQHGQPGLSQPSSHLYSHPHHHPQQQQQQMSPQVAQQQLSQHASSQRQQPSQQQHSQQQHHLHQPAGPSPPQQQQQQSQYQLPHLQQQQLSHQVAAAAAPPVLTWQGNLAKSGQHMCTLQCMTGAASAGSGATPGEREPVSWPAVLDVKLRADLAYVITLFAQTASNVRAMRRLVPAGGADQRSKLCEFLGYLADKNRAGVIKLDAAGALPPRTLYLVPPSAKACADLGAEWTPTEPFLLALVVPMTAAGGGRG